MDAKPITPYVSRIPDQPKKYMLRILITLLALLTGFAVADDAQAIDAGRDLAGCHSPAESGDHADAAHEAAVFAELAVPAARHLADTPALAAREPARSIPAAVHLSDRPLE